MQHAELLPREWGSEHENVVKVRVIAPSPSYLGSQADVADRPRDGRGRGRAEPLPIGRYSLVGRAENEG